MGRIQQRVFFKGLKSSNSVFAFCKNGYYTKVKESRRLNYFTQGLTENSWIHTFHMGISAMWNADRNTTRSIKDVSEHMFYLSRYQWTRNETFAF